MGRMHGLVLLSCLLALNAACSSSNSGGKGGPGDGSSGLDGGPGDGDGNGDGDGLGDGDGDGRPGDGDGDGDGGQINVFTVLPSELQTLEVDMGGSPPTVTFQATLDGEPVEVGWNVDRGEVGGVTSGPSTSAVFTPTARLGGLVTVRAGLNGQVLERQVFVKLRGTQNGPSDSPADQGQLAPDVPSLSAGGGIGGVGGEGLGVALDDPTLNGALDTPGSDGTAENLELLYPYDGTVWPRGLLAPLLQWRSSLGSVDAIQIELATDSGSFSWSGRFGAPAILQTSGRQFLRHPIPQSAWAAATDTAGGITPDGAPDRLTVKLTVAKGGQAYGPISQTWVIAPARLSGTIYYSSYGTNLAKNHGGAVGGDGRFGGAVLSIRVGDAGPKLVAGTDGGNAECRVCHSVSADGSRLVALDNRGGHPSHSYELSPTGAVESSIGVDNIEYPGLTSDGRYALTPSVTLLDLENAGMVVPTAGLTDIATSIGPASFSYDGKKVAFNPMNGSLANPQQKVVVMDFDAATNTFTNPVTAVDNAPDNAAQHRPGWPTFTPDGAIVYHQQVVAGDDGNTDAALHTRKGAKAYLAWTPADAANAAPLNRLNGLNEDGSSYLPKLPAPVNMTCGADNSQVGSRDADHADDANLNYEPTVNPIASGGYAWVVFTSRRMYGSVADIPPFCSDPRGVNLITNTTTKKLWVAAINLSGEPGSDISQPAFYLPGQELLAGNTRGAWVLDPCRDDGASCATGDQCCGGFCTDDGQGALVCANEPPDRECSLLQEKCETAADCCDAELMCLNGFCAAYQIPE